MRIFVRYFILTLLISFILLRLIARPTAIQTEPTADTHQYFHSTRGEPLNPDRETITFEREGDIIEYAADWNRSTHYRVTCTLTQNMTMTCESIVHYGLVTVPATDRYIFHWDQ